jgi:hypothetical protein
MITANDLLQIISEIHQYSTLLMELKDATTFGISRSSDDKLNYFRIERRLDPAERNNLVQKFCGGEMPDSLQPLPVERFLQEIEGKKARHIWLETGGAERKEMGFLSISELKAFFRAHSRR